MATRKAVIHTATGAVLRYGFCDFTADGSFNAAVETQVDLNEGSLLTAPTPAYFHKIVSGNFVVMNQTEQDAVTAAGIPPKENATALSNFLDVNAHVTDGPSGIEGEFKNMQPLVNRRELFNDEENPLYVAGFTPLVGPNGSVTNLNTIHGKLGWHNQQLMKALWDRPKDLLIYYGWLNSFNSATNGWNNEKVAQEMAQYSVLVFGDGIQDSGHGDYSNTQVIIPRIKALNPDALIFGYVTVNQTLSNFETKVDQWETLQVHGIFMDEAGYDFGKTRAEFNDRVDYVHGKTYAKLCFANAWNMDHIIGTTNDASYPNSTYNSSSAESNLTENDWYLLESFSVNTTAYSGNDGFASKSDWSVRGVKAIGHRNTYGINLASVGILADSTSPAAKGENLFDFSFVSSMMFSLEANGTSDTSYGASSAATKWWSRPDASILRAWSLSPSVQVDTGDSDVYWRYVDKGKFKLDFSSGAQTSSITKW